MATPAQADVPAPAPKRTALIKVLGRFKSVLKKSDGSRRLSRLGKSKPPAVPAEAVRGIPDGALVHKRVELFQQRAKQLADRFGLEIQTLETDLFVPPDAVRVEKPIRMRVRRVCHVCQSVFGTAPECPSCQHMRCPRCGQQPPKRTAEEKASSRAHQAAKDKDFEPDYWCDEYEKDPVLSKPRRLCGGPDLVLKRPRQRIRRTCHICCTQFAPGSRQCAQCGHNRCTDCPRDPAKKDKYPFGYPGDEFGPNSIPFYECHCCRTMFDGGVPDGTECGRCKHAKCAECPRLTPRRVEPKADTELLKRLDEKLRDLNIQ